jgi:hypothetical protein
MSEYTVTVSWTLEYDAEEVREEMLADTGVVPTMDEVEQRIQEMALTEFQNSEMAQFRNGEVTLEWSGDTMEFDSKSV